MSIARCVAVLVTAVIALAAVPAVAAADDPPADLGPARIAPDGFDFGSQQFGWFSEQQKFTVKNTDMVNMPISLVTLGGPDAADFQLTQDGCSFSTLAPGAFCAVKVRFVPTGTSPGPRQATLDVDSGYLGSSQVTLTGTAIGSPVLRVAPDPNFFGDITVGAVSSQQKFIARNITDGNVTIDAVSIGGTNPSEFQKTADLCSGMTLAPGETCIVRARFAPSSGNYQSATLEFDSDGTTVGSAGISGYGMTQPGVRIAPEKFEFPALTVGEVSKTQKWTIKNTGGTTINVDSVVFGAGDSVDFQMTASTCDDVQLQPGEFCIVRVRFKPIGFPGPRGVSLIVNTDVPGDHYAEIYGWVGG